MVGVEVDKDSEASFDREVGIPSSVPSDQPISHAAIKNDARGPENKAVSRKSANSLFIRSLAPTTTTESLTEFFSQSFPIKHATVVIDPETKQSRCYGFVSFADKEDAERAKDELNGTELEGRKIKVEMAEPRQRDHETTHDLDGHRSAKVSGRGSDLEARKSPKLIIRNLPWSIKTSEQLALLFRSYGKVKVATLPPTKKGLSAGFGFIVLRGRKNAEKALAGVNGKAIDGRTLAVDWAVDKETWQNVKTANDDDQVNGRSTRDEMDSIKSEEDERVTDMEDIPPSDAENLEDVAGDDEIDNEIDADSREDKDDTFPKKDASTTLFIRNLPFEITDDSLFEHFQVFGSVRYARVVNDSLTGRSRGTGFVCFFNSEDAISCLRAAPKPNLASSLANGPKKSSNSAPKKPSLLENTQVDATGQFTLDGRVLHVTRAVDRGEAGRLATEGHSLRDARDRDKRRFYLLAEGTVPSTSPLYAMLGPTELRMREDSAKQRQSLMKSNPSLHLSLTRLSLRNIPRHVTSKDLKALAREAVVGFAKEVKELKRQPLSKEELTRGGEAMRNAEKERKKRGKGIVKQAKIVFEGKEGSKVGEEGGAGRSRGYGFIEFYSHRLALMGLRWLNGHAIAPPKTTDGTQKDPDDRKRRLIVEFAIENAQVVARRHDREAKARVKNTSTGGGRIAARAAAGADVPQTTHQTRTLARSLTGRKRKRGSENATSALESKTAASQPDIAENSDRLAKRQRIIGRKRAMRKQKKLT